MEQRANLEFGRNAFRGLVDPNEQVGPSRRRHFRMTDLIGLSAGHDQTKGLERTLCQKFAEGLYYHRCTTLPSIGPAVDDRRSINPVIVLDQSGQFYAELADRGT
jgi:hypothetical protein